MKIPHFKNSSELSDFFNISSAPDYSDLIRFKDPEIGFSVRRKYPDNIRYKPPTYCNGEPDVVALLKIVYPPLHEINQYDENKIPIIARIMPWSIYQGNRFFPEYDFEDQKYPTKKSFEKSKEHRPPESLDFIEDFFLNHELGFIEDNNGNKISGIELLNRVFQRHCDTIHPLKGLWLQIRIWYNELITNSVKRIATSLINILKDTFNKKLNYRILFESMEKPKVSIDTFFDEVHEFKKSDIAGTKEELPTIEIFNIKANKKVAIIYSLFVLLFYTIFYLYEIKPKYIYYILEYPFLTLTFGIFTYASFELIYYFVKNFRFLIEKGIEYSVYYLMKYQRKRELIRYKF